MCKISKSKNYKLNITSKYVIVADEIKLNIRFSLQIVLKMLHTSADLFLNFCLIFKYG
jgi:hypothetical protein